MCLFNETLLEEESVYESRAAGKLNVGSDSPKLIDLFAGAGGLSLGFTAEFGHNFVPVWANDINKFAVETYNRNFGNHCRSGDIQTLIEDEKNAIPKADVVLGGPPCQGFSLLNKKRKGDPRKSLWLPFMEVVRTVDAQVFVMENVPQLLGSTEYSELEMKRVPWVSGWPRPNCVPLITGLRKLVGELSY